MVLAGIEAQLRSEDPGLVDALRTGELSSPRRLGPVATATLGTAGSVAATWAATVTVGPGLGGFVGAMAFTTVAIAAMSRWRCPARRPA